MKKNRFLSIALALAMMLGLLAGCSNTGDTPGNSPSNAGTPGASAPADDADAPAEESGSITLGHWPEDTETEAIKVHENVYVPAFNEKHPGVEAIPAFYKYAPDTYVAMAQAGNAPTVFESWYTEPEKLIRNGPVKDITDVLNERGWADVMSPAIRDLLSDDEGCIYGVPRDAYSLGLMINIPLFEQAGLVNADGSVKYPTTWEEVYEYSKIIREKTGAAGFCMQASDGGGGWHWSNIAWNYGATLCIPNDDGTFTSNINTPEAIAAMEWVQKMVQDKCVTDDPTQENWGTGFDRIGTSTAAMYIAANDAVDQPSYRGMAPDEFFLAPMPAGPGGHYTLMGGTPYFFSPDATDDEVRWALDYLEIMGKSPEVTEDAINGFIADAEYRVEKGIPVIPEFPAWTGAVVEARLKVVDEHSNIDMSLWQPYYDFSEEEGALRTEEPGDVQTMYEILNGVLQAICANPIGVDIPALMEQANLDYQAVLDAMQADVVTMLEMFHEDYPMDILKKNWQYYEPRTEHGSSLSACMYALLVCRLGEPEKAYPFFMTSAQADWRGGGKQWAGLVYIGGTHPTAQGGTWKVLAEGFAGLEISKSGELRLRPCLPPGWKRVSFCIFYRGKPFRVEVTEQGGSISPL